MKKYERNNLNIKRLLGLGVLDIRGMAEQNEALTANEYFSKVEQFTQNAPKLVGALINISKLAENARTLKELESKLGVGERLIDFSKDTETLTDLENIKNTLSEIGYTNLDFDLDAIRLALLNSNVPLAEKLAAEATINFSALYDKIKGTLLARKFASIQIDPSFGNNILLKEALEYFDYEESHRKLRILAVDDVSIVLNTLTSVLSPFYEVFALKNSSQVEKFLTHTTPELFLLDIEMSEINGFDLVPLIRKFEEHKDTPIIFLTGNSSFSNLKDAVALGACDFITKPINKEILLDKIEKNIVRKNAY